MTDHRPAPAAFGRRTLLLGGLAAVAAASAPVLRPGTAAAAPADRTPTRWGTHLPGIVDRLPTRPGSPTMALTLDACGGPGGTGIDDGLIGLLRAERIPATLFLNERWVRHDPGRTAALAADPLFTVENHGSRHVPLSITGRAAYGIPGTGSRDEVIAEVEDNQRLLTQVTGRRPAWFRAGTAHYDDVAVDIARGRGVRIAGFTVNGDAGATADAGQVRHALETAPDGAIVLLHMNRPAGATAAGLRAALPALRTRGTRFVNL